MALLNHIAAAPASLPPTEMDRIEALRWALTRLETLGAQGIATNGTVATIAIMHEIAKAALDADGRAAAAQDEAQQAESATPPPEPTDLPLEHPLRQAWLLAFATDDGAVDASYPPIRAYGWQPSGLIRELGDRPANFMEPLR